MGPRVPGSLPETGAQGDRGAGRPRRVRGARGDREGARPDVYAAARPGATGEVALLRAKVLVDHWLDHWFEQRSEFAEIRGII